MYYACNYNLHAPANPGRETSSDLVLWWLLNCTQPWQGDEYFSELARDVSEQEAPPLPWQLLQSQSQSHPSTESSRSWLVEDRTDGDCFQTESHFTAESSLQAHETALDHYQHCQRYLRFQDAGVNDRAGNSGKTCFARNEDTSLVTDRSGSTGELMQYQNHVPTTLIFQSIIHAPTLDAGDVANPKTCDTSECGMKPDNVLDEYTYSTKIQSLEGKHEHLISTISKDYQMPKSLNERVDLYYNTPYLEERLRYPQNALNLPSKIYHHGTPEYLQPSHGSDLHDQFGAASSDARTSKQLMNSLSFPVRSPSYHDQFRFSGMPSMASILAPPDNGRCRVIRGVSLWGGVTDPPASSSELYVLVPVVLQIFGGGISECCYPKWLQNEEIDGRRIIRLRRQQRGPQITVDFSIVGSALDHPVPSDPVQGNSNVLEVSCIRCMEKEGEGYQYYITSVEVVGIVELIVGTEVSDAAERRRERGRVRSNLVTYWSKKPILTRKHVLSDEKVSEEEGKRMELARRIMGYDTRRPRGFDKEVRILAWANLVPAMVRALNSYYAEVRR